MKKPEVLQVNKFYYPYIGGVEQVARQLAEGLKNSVDMQVLVCREQGRTINEIIHGVHVCRAASIGKIGNIPIPLALYQEFRKRSKYADIIQFHFPFPFGDLACLLSGYRGKVVIWWHSDVIRQKRWMLLYRPLMEWFLRRADQIIVATKGHIEGSNYLKPYQKKCIVIPFGVDRELEQRADRYWEKNKEKKYEQIQHQKGLCFLFVGRLVYYKGCDILLDAFAKLLVTTRIPHQLVIAGNGPMKEELKQKAKQCKIADHVYFTGRLSEEERCVWFERCDVFLLPSTAKSEAFGLVQIEAMAFGKPVINTWLKSGVPYVSLDHITGLTVKPGDSYSLAQAMQWMAEHPLERYKMGIEARKRVKQEYQMQVMLERIETVYQKLLSEG